jgi:hypothetical protein
MMHLKLPEKQEQTKPPTSRWREIKIRAKIHEIESKKLYKESVKQKSVSFKRLTRLRNL